MLGDENLLINMAQNIYNVLPFAEGKIYYRKNPEIVCNSVLYSQPLALNLNPGPLMQGGAFLDFLWRVLWIHIFVFFNGGHFSHLPSASSLNFTSRISSFNMLFNLCNGGDKL